MARNKLSATTREVTGKKVKQLRQESTIPAVVFGPQRESLNIAVDERAFSEVFAKAGYSSLIDFQIGDEPKAVQVIVKEVQRNPVTRKLRHVSLYQVDQNRKLTAEIPVHLVGESLAVKNSVGFLEASTSSITIHCLPADLPANIEIDISGLSEIGDTITIADIKLPEGVELDSAMQPTTALASIQAPQKMVEEEPKPEAEAAEGEAAEGAEKADGEAKAEGAEPAKEKSE